MVDGFANTPRYLLKHGAYPTCPSLVQASADNHSIAMFGFSDKSKYDVFLSASSLMLTPYPLVKGFLVNENELDTDSMKLVVLDAVSSLQPQLYAATFQAVLESFRLDSDSVAVSHQLVLEELSTDYRIETFSFFANQGPVS